MAERGGAFACLLIAVATAGGCTRWLDSWGRPVPRTPVAITGRRAPAAFPAKVRDASPDLTIDDADTAELAASLDRIAELLGELDAVVEHTEGVRRALLRVSHAIE